MASNRDRKANREQGRSLGAVGDSRILKETAASQRENSGVDTTGSPAIAKKSDFAGSVSQP